MKHLLLAAASLCLVSFLSGPAFSVSYTATPQESDSDVVNEEAAEQQESSEETLEENKAETFEDKLIEFNAGNVVLLESREILRGRIYDTDGVAIGEVKDVYLSEGGDISGIIGVFGRLSLSGDVFLKKQDLKLKGYESGYKLGFVGDEIKRVFSDLPKKAPEPAGGKVLSSKQFAEKALRTTQGDDFGEIIDVMFSEDKLHVDAALVKVNFGPVRNKTIAIPFEAVSFDIKRGRPFYSINSKMAAKVLEFSETQK